MEITFKREFPRVVENNLLRDFCLSFDLKTGKMCLTLTPEVSHPYFISCTYGMCSFQIFVVLPEEDTKALSNKTFLTDKTTMQ